MTRSLARIGPILSAVPEVTTRTPCNLNRDGRFRKKPCLTGATRAALGLQGKYMGTKRGLPAAKRAIVKKIRAEKRIRAAIAEARVVGEALTPPTAAGSQIAKRVRDGVEAFRGSIRAVQPLYQSAPFLKDPVMAK